VTNPIDLVILKDPNSNGKIDKPTLEANQLFSILQAAKTLRDRAILTLLIDTGMRAGELANLKKQHILSQEVKVFGKTDWRNIPISEETRRLLLVLISQDGKDEYVFHGERGPLGRNGVYRVVSRYMSQVGIDKPKLGPHRIRHAFAKNFLMNGGDLYSLMKIMGHSSITTTEEYLRYTDRDTIMKHNQFTPLRSVLAAAQASMFAETNPVIKEAEAILQRGSATR
jgi:integrase